MPRAELAVSNVTVRFAGIVALNDVSFQVSAQSIHALIGPNGAGKSSCFNAIGGLYEAATGSIRLGGEELIGKRPDEIARDGIGRTFQNIALSKRETVLENLLLGTHLMGKSGFISAGFGFGRARREQQRLEGNVRHIAARLGLESKLSSLAGVLPYGDQKKVEVGRALAMEPAVLLLDEPVAGMNDRETDDMAETVREIRNEFGVSVLLVEHDMRMVMGISDIVTVLNFGQVVAEGTPTEVQNNPEVIKAYIGSPLAAQRPQGAGTEDETGGLK